MSTLMHPNGFLQHDLPDGSRLHIWSPDLPPAQLVHTPIHDHTFIFESRVVMGILEHHEFRAIPTSLPGGSFVRGPGAHLPSTHEVYAVKGPCLVPEGHTVNVQPAESHFHGVGASYVFGGPNRYHDTYGAEGTFTATIMRKTQTNLAEYPTVLVPVGMKPDNDFRRGQYSEDFLMFWVNQVLMRLEIR